MSLEWLGDVGIIISVIATTLFIIGYVTLAPFYRRPIGWSLLASKTWICLAAWLAFFRSTMDVSAGSTVIQILRAMLWIGLPVISVSTFWVLLVREQVKSRQAKKDPLKEEK